MVIFVYAVRSHIVELRKHMGYLLSDNLAPEYIHEFYKSVNAIALDKWVYEKKIFFLNEKKVAISGYK